MSLGSIDDLNEAIEIGQELLSLAPVPRRPGILNMISDALMMRSEQTGLMDDVVTAAQMVDQAIELESPTAHFQLGLRFNTRARVYLMKYQRTAMTDERLT